MVTAAFMSGSKAASSRRKWLALALLLLVAALRPAVLYLEQAQLRHERDVVRARERALRLAHERMEAFLAGSPMSCGRRSPSSSAMST